MAPYNEAECRPQQQQEPLAENGMADGLEHAEYSQPDSTQDNAFDNAISATGELPVQEPCNDEDRENERQNYGNKGRQEGDRNQEDVIFHAIRRDQQSADRPEEHAQQHKQGSGDQQTNRQVGEFATHGV